jgi:hypothetical protein
MAEPHHYPRQCWCCCPLVVTLHHAHAWCIAAPLSQQRAFKAHKADVCWRVCSWEQTAAAGAPVVFACVSSGTESQHILLGLVAATIAMLASQQMYFCTRCCACLPACWFAVCLWLQPGYLRPLLPAAPPSKPEPWSDIKKDFWEKIMTGAAAGSRMLQRQCVVPSYVHKACCTLLSGWTQLPGKSV